MMGDTAITGADALRSASFTPGKARMGSMLMKGLEGQMTMAAVSGRATARIHSACGRAWSIPAKRRFRTTGSQWRSTNQRWKSSSPSGVWITVRTGWSDIGSRRGGDAQAPAEVGGDGAQGLSGVEAAGALDVGGEVPVAEQEPGLASEPLERGHEGPGLARAAPSRIEVGEP